MNQGHVQEGVYKRDAEKTAPLRRPVSVVIPAFNNRSLMAKYLPPLMDALTARSVGDEVIVVDDCGQDNTREFLESTFPTVRCLRTPTNGGFGPACNLGIEAARHPFVLLLNTDVQVSSGFLEPLLAHFANPEVFCVVPKIIRISNPPVCQSVTSYCYQKGYFLLLWDENLHVSHSVPVAFPSGACVLLDAKKLKEIGKIDPLYRPFYWEDVDLGYRAWKRGWSCLCEPSATVWHEESVTVRNVVSQRQKNIVGARNRYLFIWKNMTDWSLLALHLVLILPRGLIFLCKGDPSLLQGFWAALPRVGEVLRARRQEKRRLVRTDREVGRLFSAQSQCILHTPQATK